jgi:formylglycine-generating enzyme required for sulfatase activity
MKSRNLIPVVAVLFAAFTLANQSTAQVITTSDTFGSGANTFAIDFVGVGNAGNAADTTGFGAVAYQYRIGTYVISQNQIDSAVASGLLSVSAGAWSGNLPAANITWYEAAAFVNWMNTSTGKQAAYNLTWTGTNWTMALWSTEQAWTLGGTNLFRHKDAHYFLPSENEFYKGAYGKSDGSGYYLYATAGNIVPTPVANGTSPGTAVYVQPREQGPAPVNSSGGLSSYETMGQGGNVFQWMEGTADGANSNPLAARQLRSGNWFDEWEVLIASTGRLNLSYPDGTGDNVGFRVASVPEPSTCALLAMSAASALWWARRRR